MPTDSQLAARLDANGRARAAAKVAADEAPELIRAAKAAGMSGAEIARRLQCNESYVRRILREHREAEDARDADDGEHDPCDGGEHEYGDN